MGRGQDRGRGAWGRGTLSYQQDAVGSTVRLWAVDRTPSTARFSYLLQEGGSTLQNGRLAPPRVPWGGDLEQTLLQKAGHWPEKERGLVQGGGSSWGRGKVHKRRKAGCLCPGQREASSKGQSSPVQPEQQSTHRGSGLGHAGWTARVRGAAKAGPPSGRTGVPPSISPGLVQCQDWPGRLWALRKGYLLPAGLLKSSSAPAWPGAPMPGPSRGRRGPYTCSRAPQARSGPQPLITLWCGFSTTLG